LKGAAAAASRGDIYGRLREANLGRIQDQLLPFGFNSSTPVLFRIEFNSSIFKEVLSSKALGQAQCNG